MQYRQETVVDWQSDARPALVPGAALIGKAFSLLDAIGAAPGLVTVSELVRTTGWARPTLYRILSALTAYGYVRFDPVAQGYTLGYRFLELAQNVWAAPDLAAVASVELRRLRDMTGETAYLAVPHEGAMLSLGKFESAHVVRSAAGLGVRKPMYCTSQGKAVLAFLPDDHCEALLARTPLQPFTPNTITEPALLRAQLGIVRQRGYAIEDEEIVVGIRCVGAPILDGAGYPIAAISVAAPTWRLTRERAEQLGPEVANVARAISGQLRRPAGPQAGHGGGAAVHPAAREPAFYGADPAWDEKQGVLRWVDRLGPVVHETGGDASRVMRPGTEAPIEAAAFSGTETVLVLAGRVQRLREGSLVSDEALPDGLSIGALGTAPDEEVWAAILNGAESQIRQLSGSEGGWTVAAQIRALAWAPDGEALYAADPGRGVIYSLQAGSRSARILTRIPRVSGEPRGLAVDALGRLWIALYDGWSIARLTPEGEIDDLVALPIPRPAGLAFGGADGEALFITTARVGLTRDVFDNAPLSGRLFVARSTPAAATPSKKSRRRVVARPAPSRALS